MAQVQNIQLPQEAQQVLEVVAVVVVAHQLLTMVVTVLRAPCMVVEAVAVANEVIRLEIKVLGLAVDKAQ